jgi:hypothetical protein
MPPIPSGFSTLWRGPATKPSNDIEILKRSFDKCYLALKFTWRLAGGSISVDRPVPLRVKIFI